MLPGITNILFKTNITFNSSFLSGLFPITIGYFVLGYYLHQKKISSKLKNYSILGLIACIILGIIYLRFGYHKGLTFDDIFVYTHILVAISASLIFIICKYYFINIKPIKITNIIKEISACGFGVYLFHLIILEYFHHLNFMVDLANYNSFLEVIILDIMTFTSLTIIIWILRKIPFVKKIL